MPALSAHPCSQQRRVDRHIDAPSAPLTNSRRVRVGDAMDVPERADITPEPITISRCRELLGDEAEALSDDEVREVARHAEGMAHVLIALALQGGRIH
jgi:hypothetical protein